MEWSVRYSTGIDHIDLQHRMLFQMSEHYRHALEAGEGAGVYGLMLESLEDYARGHFGVEEACMFRYQCPVADVNGAAHRRFLEEVARFRERFATHGFQRPDAVKLVDYIDAWLSNHIARIDTRLKSCLEQPRD